MAAPRREQAFDSVSVPKGETVDERDARMDARYSFDREGDSVMVYVSRCQDALAQEFRTWHRTHGDGLSVRDSLAQRRWEQIRFGDELFPSAAGILRFAIHRLTFPADFPQLPAVAGQPAERKAPEIERFDAALDALAAKVEMPDPKDDRMSNYQRNARESRLIDQAEGLRLDVDELKERA